jgi:transcriptional regulator with GAF, ATPase, and Fis domain
MLLLVVPSTANKVLVPISESESELRRMFAASGLVTASGAMLPMLRLALKASQVSDITVLLEGETGTGKQVLANSIHALDKKRNSFPFITVHCGSISESLAESELFGHQKGAFSGAITCRKGLFQAADKGTLFLDDVNDLPAPLQAKLLDVLQRNVVRAVGSDREMPVRARVIAASNQPLLPLVRENRFRSDLYHRLNVVKLRVPPLRERPEDLPLLALQFAERHNHIYPGLTSIDSELVQFLESLPFPGNVRELEHAVERVLLAKTSGTSLRLYDWIAQSEEAESPAVSDRFGEAADVLWSAILRRELTFRQSMHQLEKKLLETALLRGGQTRREIASSLQTSERTLYHRLRCHHLSQGTEPT